MKKAASDSQPDQLVSLRSAVRFREVLRRGERRTVGGITVVSLPNSERLTRIGLVAGRGLGGAVTRNRIKRRVRNACHHVEFTAGWDHVVIPARSVGHAPFPALIAWVTEATARHG